MDHSTYTLYQKSVSAHLAKWQTRRSRAPQPELIDAALMLLRLNLDPLIPMLQSLYAPAPRGRPPIDPVRIMRALLLMSVLRYTSLTLFAQDLHRQPRLAILAGFAPFQTPSVGAFYLFLDRLENGPFQPTCAHRVPLSALRKGAHRRDLKQEKADKEARRQQILAQCDSLTRQLTDELVQHSTQPRPDDFLKRMEDALINTAVIPSARRGLLGELHRVVVCGDGSALVTGASPAGKPSCQCRTEGTSQCACPRFYSDPTADWGYDSYREVYYFGHTFYQHLVSSRGHDLPVHIAIGPASESDFTLSLKSLDRFTKASREHQLDLTIYAAVYDAGHDSLGNYEYLQAKQINPVIVLNPRTGQHPTPTGTAARVNDQGIPICPAGLLMRRHTQTANHRIVYNCPVKRPTHEDGKTVWKAHTAECPHQVLCQPDTKMGPTVSVRTDADPRYYPPLARDSTEFKRLLRERSGCERSNSTKKVTYKLAGRPCRSATHYLVRLYLISIIEHAKAWLAEDRQLCGEDWRSLSDTTKLKEIYQPG